MSCSLDSNCKLSLMESASSSNTSWKNLSSFGHALSELSEIFIIDLFDSVSIRTYKPSYEASSKDENFFPFP